MLPSKKLLAAEAACTSVNAWWYIFAHKRGKTRIKATSREDAMLTLLEKRGIRLVSERRLVDKAAKKRAKRARRKERTMEKPRGITDDWMLSSLEEGSVPGCEEPKLAAVEVCAGSRRAAEELTGAPGVEVGLDVVTLCVEVKSGLGRLRKAVRAYLDMGRRHATCEIFDELHHALWEVEHE